MRNNEKNLIKHKKRKKTLKKKKREKLFPKNFIKQEEE